MHAECRKRHAARPNEIKWPFCVTRKSVRQLLVMLSKCVALTSEHAGGAVEWVDLATARARMQAMF